MPIIISLRTSLSHSPFKRYLLKVLSYPTLTEVVMCSGYFQEGGWGYSVSSEDIVTTIMSNPNLANLQITVVGGKFGGSGGTSWEKQFKKFLSTLRSKSITHQAYIPKSKNWHAKVVIGLENTEPKIGIIGSSNLTRPAYSEKHSAFNYECDVTLLADEPSLKKHFELIDIVSQNRLSPLIAIPDPEVSQPDINERLKGLYEEIMEMDDLDKYTDY